MDKLNYVDCVIGGCVGQMRITYSKPTKVKKIVKLYAQCDKCGNHPMTGAVGQRILQEALDEKNIKPGSYVEEGDTPNDEKDKKDAEPDRGNKHFNIDLFGSVVGIGSVVGMFIAGLIINKHINRSRDEF